MESPDAKDLPQMVFAQGNQIIEALPAEGAEESLAKTIRIRRQLRRMVMLRRDASASPIRTIRSTSTSSI
jgi:hypothetical protein